MTFVASRAVVGTLSDRRLQPAGKRLLAEAELLGTVHWIASEDVARNYDDVLRKVQG